MLILIVCIHFRMINFRSCHQQQKYSYNEIFQIYGSCMQGLVHVSYTQGCWRKVTVDDFLPFLEQSSSATTGDADTANAPEGGLEATSAEVNYVPLYPRTAHPAELWPALLTKAVLKIAALE